MLKALELHGFKSFADKTRFEFPDGITVVVGPNGSGKSNVVDAIRWVLGEQSAKSLRGSEMSDVIFKGSGNGQRRPANTAEATIVFDNSTGILELEPGDVRVTRRVYRSGEGEYQINGEPCRLRDIRDLFRGTGVGTDAYSLIEQGKVDTLLQASPRERRAIFEEAAGISRFKAKKVESQRRLDRVEQNMLRLSDIVEEVERRLKSLRNQATKARRYQEYTSRLKDLRTHVGLTDFRAITIERDEIETTLQQLTVQCAELADTTSGADRLLAQFDERLETIKQEIGNAGSRISRTREQITELDTTTQLQRESLDGLENEERQSRRRLVAVNSRAGDVQLQLENVTRELAEAEKEYASIRKRTSANEEELTKLKAQLDAQRESERQQRKKHGEQLEATARLTSQLTTLESELNLAADTIGREQKREATLKEQVDSANSKAKQAETLEAQLRDELEKTTREQDQAEQAVNQLVDESSALRFELSECQHQRAAMSERLNVLEEVERRLEGIGAGTRDLLARSKSAAAGALSEVRGMVADLLEVKVEMAPLIDAALGDRAQYIVTTGHRLVRAISDNSLRLHGRVGVISVSALPSTPPQRDSALGREEGVIGCALEYTVVDEQWTLLAQHLLGTTWFVHSLENALKLRNKYRDEAWRFVTSAGEVLEPDGTVFGGPRLSSGGIVSRRSELRSLQAQLSKLAQQESLLSQKAKKLDETRAEAEQKLKVWIDKRRESSEQYALAHASAEAARQLVEQSTSTHAALADDLRQLEERHAEITAQQMSTLSGLGDLEKLVATLETDLLDYQSRLASLEKDRQSKEQTTNAAKIELARVEQRVETLRIQALRCEQDNEERNRAVSDIANQLADCLRRHRDTERAILRATPKLADAHLALQAASAQMQALSREEREISETRRQSLADSRDSRQKLQELQQQQNALQIRSGELRMKRDTVSERVRDDYGIELAELVDTPEMAEEREEIEAEIGDLRRKIGNIGAVNMESLAELEDLESRFGELTTQYDDLVKAKDALERIIQRINADSRRMFVETLDIIRSNFQELFRRSFGGGFADIVVEEDADILDAGIDIVATPPGKHSLNISLLSGGERAMTAVTLLLAIFRHRPSPFCILDEVDGPLDEANIGRFVDVLREFLATTKIVIVTHSKKTMSAATTLYGVTMQESGVSKRVSVQFNDVSEDGTIRSTSGRDEDDDGAAA